MGNPPVTDRQKVLRVFYRLRTRKGKPALTRSDIMRAANMRSAEVKAVLDELVDEGSLDFIEGYVHPNRAHAPTMYFYPVRAMEMDGDDARLSDEPNPDIEVIKFEISPVERTERSTLDPLSITSIGDFSVVRMTNEIFKTYHEEGDWIFTVSEGVASTVKWLLTVHFSGEKVPRNTIKDKVFALDCFTFSDDVRSIASKAFFRLTLPWYPESWAVGGTRHRFSSDQDRLLLPWRSRALSHADSIFMKDLDPVLASAIEAGSHKHRAAYAVAARLYDTVRSDGSSFMEAALAYTGSMGRDFLGNWANRSRVLQPLEPEDTYAYVVSANGIPADAFTDQEEMRESIDRHGGSILWLMPNTSLDRDLRGYLTDPTAEHAPMWFTDPKGHAKFFLRMRDLGVDLMPQQEAWAEEQLQD